MTLHDDIQRSAATIRARAPQRTPRVGIVLGSGWQGVADHVDDPTAIAYTDLPAFPAVGVAGHAGQLILGRLGGVEVAVLAGRQHTYEDGHADAMKGMATSKHAVTGDARTPFGSGQGCQSCHVKADAIWTAS